MPHRWFECLLRALNTCILNKQRSFNIRATGAICDHQPFEHFDLVCAEYGQRRFAGNAKQCRLGVGLMDGDCVAPHRKVAPAIKGLNHGIA